jgi:vancomycin permeability regulator SanA
MPVSEASNRYTHLFLVEREYFGFNTLESVIVADNVFKHSYSMMQI